MSPAFPSVSRLISSAPSCSYIVGSNSVTEMLPRRSRVGLTCRCDGIPVSNRFEPSRPAVTSLPPKRQAAPPPEPVPVEHSPAYLLRNRRTQDEIFSLASQAQMPEEPFSGNALEWAVRRVDQNLDKVEENPPAAAKAVWSAARSPVGTATARGVTTAAKVTVEIGAQALKAAVPVGQWMAKQGFKAVVHVLTTSSEQQSNGKKGKKKH